MMDFYFSDANLKRDRMLSRTVEQNDGYLLLETLLTFNRIKALGVTDRGQLVEAAGKSEMLELDSEATKVRRDFEKFPRGTYDAVARTVYVEGLPLTFGIDDLTKYFSRFGQVKLIELPHHRETQEPRGYCFVELASSKEAEDVLSECNNRWPSSWPQRFDGKTLRVMRKADWHQQCREYKERHAASRGPKEPEQIFRPPPPKPKAVPGCVVAVRDLDEDCTRMSVRHFAEHAVAVEYCDYLPGASEAHLRLKSPEDCTRLLEDMRLTGRMLGGQLPKVEVLSPEEEAKYWEQVQERKSDPEADKSHALLRAASGIRERDMKISRIRRWKPVASASGLKFRQSFIDTAGGSADFVAPGFGKHRRPKRAPKVIPPRKPDEVPKKRKEANPFPAVPPPSPFQLPGTTRPKKRGERFALPPASPAMPPPSPAGGLSPESPELARARSPESDKPSDANSPDMSADRKPDSSGDEASEPQEDADSLLDQADLIVSMMEDFN
ncbi:unnamed protein product [Effrenium voratum]|uniref:Uncharacterized protein n=1 Tax=Effrenium voratum TaxID=2562239 RepID=A0AA36IKS3_9DINO|nr:unnamed protein product [Effrenium voratum]